VFVPCDGGVEEFVAAAAEDVAATVRGPGEGVSRFSFSRRPFTRDLERSSLYSLY